MRSKAMFIVVLCVCAPGIALGQRPPQQQPPALQEALPRPVTITGIAGVVAPDAKWEEAWHGPENADGIVGTPDGGVLFAQEQSSTVRKLDTNGLDSAYVRNTMGGGTLAMDSQGRIITASRTCTDPGRANNPANPPCKEPGKIAIVYPEKERKVLADGFQGKPFGRPSDVVVDKKGAVYFTVSGAYYLKPGGEVANLGADINGNGIMLSPDEKTLYVTNREVIVSFDIQPDGTVTNRRNFATLENGGRGDGMAVDAAGRLYVTTLAGVQVFSSDRKYLGSIPTPRNAISVAFSGPGKKILYVVTSGALAPDGREYTLPPDFRNNAKTIYRMPMLAEGFRGRAK